MWQCASVCASVCVCGIPHQQPTSAPLATFPSTGQAADLLDTAARLCWSSSPEETPLSSLAGLSDTSHIWVLDSLHTHKVHGCAYYTHFSEFITAPGSNHLKFKTLGLESVVSPPGSEAQPTALHSTLCHIASATLALHSTLHLASDTLALHSTKYCFGTTFHLYCSGTTFYSPLS